MPVRATVAEFREAFPEFTTPTDAQIERRIDDAEQLHAVRLRAQLYLIAHLLHLDAADDDSGAGEITSQGVGPMSVSFVTQAERGSESFYTRTEYGRRYLALAKRAPTLVMPVKLY